MDARDFTADIKASIVIAAVSNTPREAGESEQRFQARAGLTAMDYAACLDDSSPVWRAVSSLSDTKAKILDTVVSVEVEPTSKRAVVTIEGEKGRESARTDRTDTPVGWAVARRAHELIGQRAVVYLGLDSFTKNGLPMKHRSVRHIVPA